jgi:hypothetical protein
MIRRSEIMQQTLGFRMSEALVEVEDDHGSQLTVGGQDDGVFHVFRETSMLDSAAHPNDSGRVYKRGQCG